MNTKSISEMTELMVPLGPSRADVRAVPVAGRLAHRLGLGLRLFSAADDEPGTAHWLRQVAHEHLPGFDVAVEVASSPDPTKAICAAAGDQRIVCMATAGSLRPHGGHVGSVAEGVVREIGRVVALVGPHMVAHPGESTRRVIVPVDGSELSEASLAVAGDLARALGVPLYVVTNIDPKTEQAAGATMTGDDVAAESGYVHRLATHVGNDFGVEAEYEVLHGTDPARAIVDFTGADATVVMSTHGRSGLTRLFGGSVATGVVAHSQRAVFVWRPEEA